mmetsp:Transcript_55915/g.67396  ORF Transcript_55915/g.67396 Transcript_55915/m.67396 type:complete len:112 (+) Transcript_55915:117-452(+)
MGESFVGLTDKQHVNTLWMSNELTTYFVSDHSRWKSSIREIRPKSDILYMRHWPSSTTIDTSNNLAKTVHFFSIIRFSALDTPIYASIVQNWNFENCSNLEREPQWWTKLS